MWGREILHFGLSTVVPGAPSWKPLPVLVTTPLAAAGDAAPALWLLVARAGALAGLVVAFRLADRLVGRWAGVLTVAGLVLSMGWMRGFAHGYSEPLAIGLLLGAVDRHLSGRHRSAFALGALVSLTRPEASLLLVLYAGVLLRRRRVHPLLVATVLAAVPALWVVPDWIGSGDLFHADKVSRMVVPTGAAATLAAFGKVALLLPPPLTAAALASAVLLPREGHRALAGIGALAGAWSALLAAMMLAGYPASPRFFILPAALLCVVGAAGSVLLAEAAPGRRLALAAAATLALAAVPLVAMRAEATGDEGLASITRARFEDELETTVDRGRGQLLRCGTPVIPNGLTWTKGVVAWDLGLRLRSVHGIATSGFGFDERLAAPGDAPLPRLAPDRSVTVRPHMRRFVLLSPYGDARIRVSGRPGMRLKSAAADGPWRAMLSPRAGPCSRS